ncbi:NAD-dependent methanol dehydrogenase [Nocardia farcinica]|uniref:iron-containing alcohol dehydrogenase family protein n=1 Tax=Nocardia farcinica TaxID=37329 RepID=UPI000C002CB6|nr:iron-containing alcohol dehydrogenase [Nocardia farcinica]PFW98997.1 NAD-dependent methanol dehydrogenase [Nocardia farcinica]PFX05930.1 NAD-dependent methanol dehydrogenase [Nocardia farcinica]
MSTATFPRFAVRTEVVSGLGSLSRLDALVAGFGHREVAVIADTALEQVGVLDRVLDHAVEAVVVCLTLVDPDPDVAVVERAATNARAAGARCVLAIGGGSALGVGKAVGIRLTNNQRIDAYEGRDKVDEPPAPTIAVPTTAGSGSEVSNALVLHEDGRDNEIVVRGELCAPRAAVLDATVLRTLPRTPLVHAALDALSHALESLWARGASYFTAATAIQAARSIIERLPAAVAGADDGSNAAGANDEVLQELLEASCAANIACGNSGLALVHALSSSPSVRVPHGLQNAVLLPHVARFNAPLLAPEALALLPLVEGLYDELGLVASFAALDLPHGGVDGARMLEASARNPFRANNLRPTTDADLVGLLRSAGATFSEEIL